jgi:hypothetical protein
MVGTWLQLQHQPTFPQADTMLLLTDGTVFCLESSSASWWALTPDASGSYVNGSWAKRASTNYVRQYFASAVLADGRVFVAGGELGAANKPTDQATVEIYDPTADQWTKLDPPPEPNPPGGLWITIGDAPSCVLFDGKLLLGRTNSLETALFDPTTDTFTPGPDKADSSSEETWTLLPDGSVLTLQCEGAPNAEKYLPSLNQWVNASFTNPSLVQKSSIEIGPAMLLPDGRVFALGSTGHTAFYTPPADPQQQGSWTAGPDLPVDARDNLMMAKDAPACLLPNGHVLCAISPYAEGVYPSGYPGPTSIFEFDGTTFRAVHLEPWMSATQSSSGAPYISRMLLLPTGQVLFAQGVQPLAVYTPDGAPDPAWAPVITTCPAVLQAYKTYTVSGLLFNGLSQAVSYGDDAQMATNYPLVRIEYQGSQEVHYCRTFDIQPMGVATGPTSCSTSFKLPPGVPPGAANLVVVANGIPSAPQAVHIDTLSPSLLQQWLERVRALLDALKANIQRSRGWR